MLNAQICMNLKCKIKSCEQQTPRRTERILKIKQQRTPVHGIALGIYVYAE